MTQPCVVAEHCRPRGLAAGGTVAVLLPVSPRHAWGVLNNPGNNAIIFSSVKAVKVGKDVFSHPLADIAGNPGLLGRLAALQGGVTAWARGTERLAVLQDQEVRILGWRTAVRMQLAVEVDHAARQVRYTLARRNRLMRSVVGVTAVLPLVRPRIPPPAAPGILRGEEVLAALRSQPEVRAAASGRRADQHCIVLMHHGVLPVAPLPPPFGGMLQGSLLGELRGMMHELHSALSVGFRA